MGLREYTKTDSICNVEIEIQNYYSDNKFSVLVFTTYMNLNSPLRIFEFDSTSANYLV